MRTIGEKISPSEALQIPSAVCSYPTWYFCKTTGLNYNFVYIFAYIHSSYTEFLRCRSFLFFFGSTTISRIPWRRDRPYQSLYLDTGQHKHRINARTPTHTHIPNIHALSDIRTHDHSVRAREDSWCLRSLGYHGRPKLQAGPNKRDPLLYYGLHFYILPLHANDSEQEFKNSKVINAVFYTFPY
jgi:hypothetical protein